MFSRARNAEQSLRGVESLGAGEGRGLSARARELCRILVTAAAFALGAYLIVQGKDTQSQNFGFGIVGTVVGYWLR